MKRNTRPVKTKIHKLYFLYRLIHHGFRETKRFMSSCVCLCDCCDSLKDACHRHVSQRAQTFDSAHEDTTPGHATTYRGTKQVICASTLATSALAHAWCCLSTQLSLPQSPWSIPTLPAKSLSPVSPSALLPFSLPNPQFLLFQLFTMDEEEQDENKGGGWCFLISPALSSKAKKIGCFSLGSLTVLNQILIKITELLPHRCWRKYIFISLTG